MKMGTKGSVTFNEAWEEITHDGWKEDGWDGITKM